MYENRTLNRGPGTHVLTHEAAGAGLRIEQPVPSEWTIEWSDSAQPMGEKWRPSSSMEVPTGAELLLVALDGSVASESLAVGPALVTLAVRTPSTIEHGLGQHYVRVIVRLLLGAAFVPSTQARRGPSSDLWPGSSATAEVLLDDEIDTDYGQFDVIWDDGFGFDGDMDKCFRDQVNGLVGAASPTGVYLNLARRSGGSMVRIESLKEAPSTIDQAWEDVVQVSTTVPLGARPTWSTWAGESSGDLRIAPGSYRLRVSARGRDAGAENEFAEELLDFYLVQLWPGPHEPDEVLRRGSENARYWHAQVGGRR